MATAMPDTAWLRPLRGPLGVTAAVVAAVLVGLFVPFERYVSLLIVGLVVAGGPLVLSGQMKRPAVGLALLLLTSVVMPLEVGVGQSTVNLCALLAAALCGVWGIHVVVVRGHATLHASRTVIAVLSLMSAAVLSFIVGQYPWFPTPAAPIRAQIGGLGMFLVSGGLFLLIGHQLASIAQLRRLTWWFVALGVVAVIASEVQALDIKVGSIALTNPASIGSMFWVWFVAVTFSQSLFNRELPFLVRAALFVCGLVAIVRGVVLAFAWVSGWLPPLVAVGLILLLRFPRLTIGAGVLSVAPLLMASQPILDKLMGGESYSLMTRIEALSVLSRVIEHNPWLGFGPANYYHYTLLYPILGWYVQFNSHNNYIDLILQVGVVGLLAFIWWVGESFWLCLRLRARTAAGFTHAYAVGALGGLLGSLVAGLLADWIIPFSYNIGLKGFRSSLLFWFFLGGALALHRLTWASATVPQRQATEAHDALVLAEA